MFRIAKAIQTVNNGQAGVVELPMPMIEGQIYIPKQIQFVNTAATQAQASTGLSFWRDNPGHADAHTAPFNDDSLWIHRFWGPNDFNDYVIDLRDLDIEIAGPQAFTVFNNQGTGEIFMVKMWYETKNVPHIVWANLARLTSYEDPEV